MSQDNKHLEVLDNILLKAVASYNDGLKVKGVDFKERKHIDIVLQNQEKRKGALAVLVTLLVKKVVSPEQDIRLHRTEFDGGFSGRRLDTNVVTPFLRANRFPSMSESGWLTRSFEQPHPFDLDYPGKITPKALKQCFLLLIDAAQQFGKEKAAAILHSLFIGLVEARDRNTRLDLARPVNLSIAELVDRLSRHHDAKIKGAARLPVLAVHAILSVLSRELNRYSECKLLPLEAHTTADSRSNLIGDISVIDGNDTLFEGYEIKHNVPISSELIRSSFAKLQTTPVKVFYILTTYPHDNYDEFRNDIELVAKTHGCQLIVNGVDRTLLYYLRLIGDTRSFIDAYVSHLETDAAITFDLKEYWNQLAASR